MNLQLNILSREVFLTALAEHVLAECGPDLPDISHVQIILPNAQATRQFRHALNSQTQKTLIGPYVGSLTRWLNDHVPLTASDSQIMSWASRQLLLFDALKQHSTLFKDNNLWQVCDSLLQLFDELNRHRIQLMDNTFDVWHETLKTAYGIHGKVPENLQHEARIVFTLWQAWHTQTQSMHLMDEVSASHLRLQNAWPEYTDGLKFYVVGYEQLNSAELAWCQQLANAGKLVFVNQVFDTTTENTYHWFLHKAYDVSASLLERAQALGKINHQPIIDNLSVFAASDHENQAHAIAMQVRIWLANSANHIAIVTEDRKLGRRVRALLERSNISIEDTAGWSLSTTSAVACLERWLECIEEDFSWLALLDLLKSPFFCAADHREQHLSNVFRFEQDIVLHERITSDIHRYKTALQQRRTRLMHWQDETFDALNTMLDQLDAASGELRNLYLSKQSRPAIGFLEALTNSLELLHINQNLASDMAGQVLLQVLSDLSLASKNMSATMYWQDLRAWLANALEQEQFMPQSQPAAVQLMNLKQAQYCRFDALIIAGANATSLPGRAVQTVFFNHAVRRHLGLKSWREEKAEAFVRFKQLLQSANQILITYTREQNNEWLPPSSWVTSLVDFAELACGIDLQNDLLQQYLNSEVRKNKSKEADVMLTAQPQPVLNNNLVPHKYSVSAYQRLVDCPYKFFASEGLSLKAEERITRELMKSEYGEQVHEILHAFFEKCPGLPAPFKKPVTELTRDEALAHLNTIAVAVFERDSDDSMQRRDWQQAWSQTAPQYIEWLIHRQQNWQFHQGEQKVVLAIDEHAQLQGRLDRIEKQKDMFSIIDYKTGNSPSKKSVLAGEDVQLLSYAAFMQNVTEVAYLNVNSKEVKIAASLAGEDLQVLQALNMGRLINLNTAIKQGEPMPAWGDAEACEYCAMKGLCRKQIWEQVS